MSDLDTFLAVYQGQHNTQERRGEANAGVWLGETVMDLYEVIKSRYSVRSHLNKPVERPEAASPCKCRIQAYYQVLVERPRRRGGR